MLSRMGRLSSLFLLFSACALYAPRGHSIPSTPGHRACASISAAGAPWVGLNALDGCWYLRGRGNMSVDATC